MLINLRILDDGKIKLLSALKDVTTSGDSLESLFSLNNLQKLLDITENYTFYRKYRIDKDIIKIKENNDDNDSVLNYIALKQPDFHERLWKGICKKVGIEVDIYFDSDIYYGTYDINSRGKIENYFCHSYPRKKKIMIRECGKSDCYKHSLIESYEYVSEIEDNWILDRIDWNIFEKDIENDDTEK